jgi:hypothetical protein
VCGVCGRVSKTFYDSGRPSKMLLSGLPPDPSLFMSGGGKNSHEEGEIVYARVGTTPTLWAPQLKMA